MHNIVKIKIIILFVLSTFTLNILFTNCSQKKEDEATNASVYDPLDVGSSFSGQVNGNIQIVSKLGEVFGYALDPGNPTATIRVIFYVDGPVGTGQYAGEVQANVTSYGTYAGHYYSFKLPAAFADGRNHTLYAYGYDDQSNYMLYNNLNQRGGFAYQAYTPRAEAVFNEQIRTFVQSSCTSCHGTFWAYNSLYTGPLTNPTPLSGGTATSNLFIRKMSGLTSHGGGTFCSGGVNSGICSEIQRWWNAEFSN